MINRSSIPAFFLSLLCSIFTAAIPAGAQVTINGKVIDEAGEALIGVNVVEKNSTNGAITDIDGNFSLEVRDPNSTLVFSYVGYNSKEIPLKGQTTLEVTLSQGAELLDEVVVVGYGTQRKSDLTGSVNTVKSEEIREIATANVAQALQGKIPGVQVTSATGRPGDSPVVRIRGTGTTNNASPIFVVDGLIVNDISFLNPTDVESVEVLKDASAAAIYGTRGANGVIIITTRRGIQGQKARFVFNSYYGVQEVERQIELANAREYALLVNEIATNTGSRPPYADPDAFGEGTDWQDVIYRQAPIQNYNLNISGGTESMTYSISGDVFLQDGIIRSSNFNRYTLRINNEYNLVKNLKFGHNISFARILSNGEPGGIVFNAYAADPTAPIFDESINNYGNTSRNSNVSNPAAQLEFNDYNRRWGQQLVGNGYMEAYLFKDFTLRSSLGFNLSNDRIRNFVPQFFVNDRQQNPESRIDVRDTRATDWQWENTLTYQKEIGRHRFNILGGYTTQEQGFEELGGSRTRLIGDTEEFYYLDAGDQESQTNFNRANTPERYISFLFRANYVFNDRYLFTASLRRDGSSKFGSERRFGNFPSLAVAWRVIEEPFLQDQKLITNLKLRASWGRLGNDKINANAAIPTVRNNLNAVFGPDETLRFGASLVALANPFLQWEETRSINIGAELGFFDNRLTAEIDYFDRRTEKILVQVPIPDYVGSLENPYVNAADVLNRGWDFLVNWRSKAGKFQYQIGLLGSLLDNEVLSLGTGNSALRAVNISGEFATLTEVGDPIGAFYGYRVAGVYQNAEEIRQFPNRGIVNPGDLRFEDVNGDGLIDTRDRVNLGSPIPNFTYGVNLGFDVAGFDFSADLYGVSGNKILNAKQMFRGFGVPNFETAFLNRWTGEGSSNQEPRITNGGYPNYAVSDRFLEDGSFLRLRSIQLGYTLPAELLQRFSISNLRIFFTGNNVFTITDYSGYSPEISSNNVLEVGIDRGIYPISRTYTFGLNVGF